MSYRKGDHSTSDASQIYRTEEEMKKWNEYLENIGDPIERFYNYLLMKKWITEEIYNDMVEKYKVEVSWAVLAEISKYFDKLGNAELYIDSVVGDKTKRLSNIQAGI